MVLPKSYDRDDRCGEVATKNEKNNNDIDNHYINIE